MARCSSCGHENGDWVPAADLLREREIVATIRRLFSEVMRTVNAVMDTLELDRLPGGGGPAEVRQLRKRRPRRDGGGGAHRGPKL